MAKKNKKRTYGSAKDVAEKRSFGANYGYLKLPKDVKMFTPEADTVAVLDILPYEVTDNNHLDKVEVGTIWYKKPVKVHRYIGVGKDSYVCPTTFGKPCPICEHGDELRQNEGDEKAIAKTRAKDRNIYAVRVLSYDGKKKFDKKTIHLFDFSDFLFQEPFETQLKRKKEFDTFFLPEEGYSLEITFDEGSYDGNKFAKVTRVDFIERKKQYTEDFIDEVPNLDEVLQVLDYDELESKFFGDADFSKEDADSDEGAPKKDKKKKKKKKEVEVEMELPETKKKKKKKKKEEVEEEPEPEEKPKKAKRKKKEEPEPEVEEEPEEKPKKDKKKKKKNKKK